MPNFQNEWYRLLWLLQSAGEKVCIYEMRERWGKQSIAISLYWGRAGLTLG
jgi:hypothetical protein